MDWYFGSGIDDLVVPKEQDLSDRFPSPESWVRWGMSTPGNMGSLNKCSVMNTDSAQEELDLSGRGLYNEAEMDSSVNAKSQSSSSSACGGSSDESLNVTPPSHHHQDYQLDDLFMNSLLENFSGNEDPYFFSPDSQQVMKPTDNLLADVVSNCHSFSSNEQSIGSSKRLKTHETPTQIFQKREVGASNLEVKNVQSLTVPLANGLVQSAKSCIPEPSLEESVLRELETVMTQLPDKTRICFRDAFYRLAKNTQQNSLTNNQSRNLCFEPEFPGHDAKMRSEYRNNPMESETNTIDRTIASLTFNKIDVNIQNFPLAKRKAATGSFLSPRDCEVPNFMWKQSPITTDNQQDHYFLRNSAG